MILYHRVSGKSVGAYVVSKETACFSDEHLYFDTLWVKVRRTLASPELVWSSYNVAVSLCCVLRKVISLSLCRISSFKRSWKLSTGVSTCLYDLWITWSLQYNIWRSSQTDISLYFQWKKYIYCLTKVKVDNITLRLVLALKLRHTKKFKLIILMFIGKWRSGRSNNNLRSYCRLWLGKVRLQKILRNLYRLAFFCK